MSTPMLSCENSSDLYTTSASSKGNKALIYPIGLITADEVMLSGSSGGVFDGSYNYQKMATDGYLATGSGFWTMTPAGYYYPFGYEGYDARLILVDGFGSLDDNTAYSPYTLRPVINIREDVTISGNGTMSNPYKIS